MALPRGFTGLVPAVGECPGSFWELNVVFMVHFQI